MEKNKTFKILAIVGLVVAVVGLAIGFAAFSATLNINTFNATATKGDETTNFVSKLGFANDAECTPTGSATATAGTATGTTWNGITATFTKPGESITCTATVKNESAYIAYLTGLSTVDSAKITCSGSAQNKDAVCSAMSANLTLSDSTLAISSSAVTPTLGTNSQLAATTGTETATLVLTYAEGGAIPDADVTVTIPTIQTVFATAK